MSILPAPLTPRHSPRSRRPSAAFRTARNVGWIGAKRKSSRAFLIVALLSLFAGVLFPARADNQLTGTIIGTSGSFNNAGNTKEKAMDGNTSTFLTDRLPTTIGWGWI